MRRFSQIIFRMSAVCLGIVLLGALPKIRAEEARAEAVSSTELLSVPAVRQGYYFSIGALGGAAFYYHEGDGWLPVFGGGGGELHIGQVLNRHIGIGLNLGFMGGGNADRNLLRGRIGLEVRWNIYEHWFVRPVVGFGFSDFYRRHENVEKILGTVSGSYSLAGGYDFVIGKKKYGSGGYTVSPTVWVNGANGINLHNIAFGIGIEIARFGGLDKNQLKLPSDEAF